MKFNSAQRLSLMTLTVVGIAGVVMAMSLLHGDRTTNQSSDSAHISASANARTEQAITSTIASLLDIPLYPGAEVVEGDPLNDNVDPHARTKLRTSAPPDNVLEFYEEALLSKGWLPDDRPLGFTPPEDIRRFRWFDSSGASPYALVISVYMRKFDNGDPLVEIDRDKWADIYNLPLYPDAADVKVTDVQPFTNTEYIRYVTTAYSTNADRKHIEEYYNAAMPQIGCYPLPEGGHTVVESPSKIPDTGFGCGSSYVPHSMGVTVIIKITPHEGKPTEVEVLASGVDVGDRNKLSLP